MIHDPTALTLSEALSWFPEQYRGEAERLLMTEYDRTLIDGFYTWTLSSVEICRARVCAELPLAILGQGDYATALHAEDV